MNIEFEYDGDLSHKHYLKLTTSENIDISFHFSGWRLDYVYIGDQIEFSDLKDESFQAVYFHIGKSFYNLAKLIELAEEELPDIIKEEQRLADEENNMKNELVSVYMTGRI